MQIQRKTETRCENCDKLIKVNWLSITEAKKQDASGSSHFCRECDAIYNINLKEYGLK